MRFVNFEPISTEKTGISSIISKLKHLKEENVILEHIHESKFENNTTLSFFSEFIQNKTVFIFESELSDNLILGRRKSLMKIITKDPNYVITLSDLEQWAESSYQGANL
jgi:hypothetical protein